ncbi:hypothetical protein GCM10022261_03470 [Brevibacterium daeguense]|uniref:DUF4381 domain-containing protein n=1 Tax=Brevibacterium daeguense TaxID=909936 RepID=A0ABP8EFW1_9MICO|nr:hypothetical protein [Brevibacterium daeguense]
MNVAELHPLLTASPWWAVVAVAGLLLGLLVAGWPLLAALWRASERRGTRLTPVPEQTRVKYLQRIDEIEKAWQTSSLDSREVAQQLGTVVRDFARAAWGLKVDHMTLSELQSHRIEPLAVAVSRLYAAEFSRDGSADCTGELLAARELVGRWS